MPRDWIWYTIVEKRFDSKLTIGTKVSALMMKNVKTALLTKKTMIPLVLLFSFWLILSPSINMESIIIGVMVSLMVVLYSRDVLFDSGEAPFYSGQHFVNMVKFTGVLLIEVFKANIDVAKIVLNPSLPIQPHFIEVPIMIKNDFNKVIYGNAVTLTPGTLTVDITDKVFVIHALTEEAAKAMENSFIETWILRQEEEKP